jgi:PIN domain nuclease of toxin-antitoxin system
VLKRADRDRCERTPSMRTWIEDSARDLRLQHVDVGYAIAVEAFAFPEPFHCDPNDRVLVATAGSYQATLLTADDRLLAYSHVRTGGCRTWMAGRMSSA